MQQAKDVKELSRETFVVRATSEDGFQSVRSPFSSAPSKFHHRWAVTVWPWIYYYLPHIRRSFLSRVHMNRSCTCKYTSTQSTTTSRCCGISFVHFDCWWMMIEVVVAQSRVMPRQLKVRDSTSNQWGLPVPNPSYSFPGSFPSLRAGIA